jgi:DNA-binding NarL/FixJ family response regulator
VKRPPGFSAGKSGGSPAVPPPPAGAGWADIFATLDEVATQRAGLTPAESAVLLVLRRGLTNREIAAQLGETESAVKRRVSACLKKFRVPTRTRLIALLR